MKKILFFIILCLSYPSYSQMVDLMGSLGVQGALTMGDTESVAQGISSVNRYQILRDLTQTAMEIKTQYMGDYISVDKTSVSGNPFSRIDWDLSYISSNLFYIQLNQIDKKTCSYLLSSRIGTVRTELNDQSGSDNCLENNQIRFIFD